jgi:predicted DNA-binding protein
MPRIPREVIEHHLKIYPDASLVQQKLKSSPCSSKTSSVKKSKKLLDVGFIWEVHHPRWLANPVVVSKASGKLRVCIDFSSLNKACPKDPFPLPRIDQIVDSTFGCDLLCFLDVYSGFHQIPMSREDEEHTAFITVDGLYCYVSMPYGLKNALHTFVCAMYKTSSDLIRDLIEVYVDDIIVKIKSQASLLDNLALVFDRLCLTRTKLNPDKCVFGVRVDKLLGFLVSYWGI